MDFDGDVDFDDVHAFVLGLTRPSAYEALYGAPLEIDGDINGDGQHDFDDITGFQDLLHSGSELQSVPEPTTLFLASLALVALLVGQHGRERT